MVSSVWSHVIRGSCSVAATAMVSIAVAWLFYWRKPKK